LKVTTGNLDAEDNRAGRSDGDTRRGYRVKINDKLREEEFSDILLIA
jgi:hypothetical protein